MTYEEWLQKFREWSDEVKRLGYEPNDPYSIPPALLARMPRL